MFSTVRRVLIPCVLLTLVIALPGRAQGRGFMPALDYVVGDSPISIAVADFNGDGKMDLAVANYRSNNVSVLLGKKDGSFQKQLKFAVGSAPYSIAAGDLNADGQPDIVVANAGDNTVGVLLNNGFGFKKPVNYSTAGIAPRVVVLGDFNGDGRLDVAVMNACVDENCETGALAVLLGNGDGTLQSPVTYDAGPSPVSMALGDLNSDGALDLVVAGFVNTVSVFLGNGDGTFQPPKSFETSEIPRFLALADVNKDGKGDLVVADDQYNVSIMLGNGDGSFQPATDYLAGRFPKSLVVSDFNGDGKLDLAVSVDSRIGTGKVKILLGRGDGTFSTKGHFDVGQEPTSIATADFNRDHAPDLVSTNFGSNTVSVLLNSGGTRVSDESSDNPSQAGQPVTFTATVSPSFPSVGTPTGQIAFHDGTALLGKVPLDNNGQASLATSDLSVGTHTIRAHYSGDSNFNPNHAKPILQVVQ